jgi:hypothetical protein
MLVVVAVAEQTLGKLLRVAEHKADHLLLQI